MKNDIIVGAVIIALVFVGLLLWENFKPVPLGSVNIANEYKYLPASTTPTDTLVVSGSGTLGSVVVTKAGAAGGTWDLIDATTTSALLRTNTATTTIVRFQTDAAANTYTFDASFYYGLLLDPSTSMGSSTITFR